MYSALFFVLGIIVGSFLNSLIWRTKSGKSIFRGRSQCIHCDRSLTRRDLIPLASFIFQLGRCRYCRKKISWQYPAVEVASGILFLIIWNFARVYGSCALGDLCRPSTLLFFFFITSALITLFVLDLRYFILPMCLTLSAAIISFAANLLLGFLWYNLLLGAAVGFIFFGLQYALSRGQWIGDGDAYLGLALGAVLGWPKILYAIFLAYILGAIVALVLLASGKAKRGSKLPLGVFLTVATFIIMMWGERLLKIFNV